MTNAADALAAGNAIGGFFALDVVADDDVAGWRPMVELLNNAGSIAGHVEAVRASLGAASGARREDVEPRVAASLAQQGLAARLVSPALAAIASANWVPDLDLATVLWRPGEASPVPLGVADASGASATGPEALAAEFTRLVLDRAVDPLNRAVLGAYTMSPHVLAGNVASVLIGAMAPLRVQRPDLAPAARAVVIELLRGLPDAGAVDAATGRYRRTTCCLYYRLPHGGLCGDCVLDAIPATTGR